MLVIVIFFKLVTFENEAIRAVRLVIGDVSHLFPIVTVH